jgi:hypothetical protein
MLARLHFYWRFPGRVSRHREVELYLLLRCRRSNAAFNRAHGRQWRYPLRPAQRRNARRPAAERSVATLILGHEIIRTLMERIVRDGIVKKPTALSESNAAMSEVRALIFRTTP